MEVPLGIIPGGGACVNLGRFLGVARTMEAGQNESIVRRLIISCGRPMVVYVQRQIWPNSY